MEDSEPSSSQGGDDGGRTPLPTVVRVKEVFVRKGREWGFVLRGTTTQFGSLNLRVYTCSIDSITLGGPAEVSCRLIVCGSRKQVSAQRNVPCRAMHGLFACFGFTCRSWNVNSCMRVFSECVACDWYGSVGNRAFLDKNGATSARSPTATHI